jgi:phosphate transport system permease protein
MIKIAVLSPSLSGISSAVVLGLGRALGETMAVTMLIGNSPIISKSIFAPAATMASVMANEYTDANSPLHVSSLCYLALLLFLITFLSNLFAKSIVKNFSKIG